MERLPVELIEDLLASEGYTNTFLPLSQKGIRLENQRTLSQDEARLMLEDCVELMQDDD